MQEKQNIFLPIAIVIAAILIAGTMIFTSEKDKKVTPDQNPPAPIEQANQRPAQDPAKAREISMNDHIRGDINAKIKIIEYSDIECPFCKRFHEVLKKTYLDLGNGGKDIALVFRNFPLTSLHQKSYTEALATECANAIGGQDVFWRYLDLVFEKTPSNDGINLADLSVWAEQVGLNRAEFDKCLAEKKFASKVDTDMNEAMATGAMGTPWSIIILPDGTRRVVNGYLPEEQFKTLIKGLLENK